MMLLFFFLCFAAAAAGTQPRGNRGFGRSTAQTDATPLSVAGLLHLAHGEDIPGHLADEDHSAMIREIDKLRQVLEGQPQGEQGLPPGNASCQTDAQGLLGWQLAQLRQRELDARGHRTPRCWPPPAWKSSRNMLRCCGCGPTTKMPHPREE